MIFRRKPDRIPQSVDDHRKPSILFPFIKSDHSACEVLQTRNVNCHICSVGDLCYALDHAIAGKAEMLQVALGIFVHEK